MGTQVSTTVSTTDEEPFRFEPDPIQPNWLGRQIKKITKNNPTAIKVAAYALIAFTFICFALSMSALSTGIAIGGFIGAMCMLPLGFEANKLRREVESKEMRDKIISAFGGEGKFNKVPVVELPNNDFKKLKVEDIIDVAKGKDSEGNLFVVFRFRDEDNKIDYLEAIFQNSSGEWRKKKHLNALGPKGFDWKSWREKTSFFKSYDSKLSKKDLAKLSEKFNPK